MNKGLTGKVLDWTEEKFDELDGNKKFDIVKAVGLGGIVGLIDSFVLCCPFLLGTLMFTSRHKK